MTTYVALLRAINLGSRNKIAMPELKAAFVDLGFKDVHTYIQSGNVVFRSGKRVEARAVERAIAGELGVDCRVLLRTGADMAAVVEANPFDDVSKLHVTFLDTKPRAALEVPAGDTTQVAVVGREVYLYCPDGYGRSKVSNAYIEKRLDVVGTTRGWKTVAKLAELAAP